MENLNLLYEAILTGNLEESMKLTQQAVDSHFSPQQIIDESMAVAMAEVGSRFESHQAFVPELLMAARAMKGSLDILKPLMTGGSSHSAGKVVIGTVKGDLHDIGKNLVASMLEGAGFEVVNLGVNISSDQFVSAVKENSADILCMSALLTTTMVYMKEVIGAIESSGLRDNVKIMIGGAPVNQKFAEQIGADCYTDNANAAVIQAKSLLLN